MTLKHLVFALASFFLPQGREGDNVLIADGSRNYLYVCPRVRPPHRSRPRFLPQGREGDDTLTATGDYNELRVCPASALPTAPDLVFFRRAAPAPTPARGM